jgi:hypothetical protein
MKIVFLANNRNPLHKYSKNKLNQNLREVNLKIKDNLKYR